MRPRTALRRRTAAVGLAALAVPLLITLSAAPSQAEKGRFGYVASPGRPALSGAADPRVLRARVGAAPSDAAAAADDAAAAAVGARASDDVQANGDSKRDPRARIGNGEGQPQNETSIAVNPTDPDNVIGSANDYETNSLESVQGIYTSFDGGRTFPYSRHARQPITPDRRLLVTGDPVVTFDSEGTAYTSFIAFGRADCDSYVAVSRSTDKGVTWSIPVDGDFEGSELQVGDGIVEHNGGISDCRVFHDKEWMAAGRRPAGAALVPGTDRAHLSPDRIYLTWTRFDFGLQADSYLESSIYAAWSDDQGRHWSGAREISGRSARLCGFQRGDRDGACDESQFSVPVVDPRTGAVYVAFKNSNVESSSTYASQYLVVRSTDGGATWSAPSYAARVVDGPNTYPVCAGNQTLDLMCARMNAAGNIDVDPRTGTLYLTWADNRNGTAGDTNTDVFVKMSTDGGRTWVDRANLTGNSRDDQFFPWLSVAPDGTLAVVYFDRRYTRPKLIDTSLSVSIDGGTTWATRRVSEVSWNPDLAFRLGVFIGDYNGLDTTADTAFPMWTDARFGRPNVAGNNPPRQQSEVMVDAEPLR